MAVIKKVLGVEGRTSRSGKIYRVTHVRLEDGLEIEVYGEGHKVGDKLEVFFDDRWGKIKATRIGGAYGSEPKS